MPNDSLPSRSNAILSSLCLEVRLHDRNSWTAVHVPAGVAVPLVDDLVAHQLAPSLRDPHLSKFVSQIKCIPNQILSVPLSRQFLSESLELRIPSFLKRLLGHCLLKATQKNAVKKVVPSGRVSTLNEFVRLRKRFHEEFIIVYYSTR